MEKPHHKKTPSSVERYPTYNFFLFYFFNLLCRDEKRLTTAPIRERPKYS